MATCKIRPLIVSMSASAVCANMVNAFRSFVYRFFVGSFISWDALGSIGLVFPLNNLTAALTIMLSISGSARMACMLGESDVAKTSKAFTNVSVIAVALTRERGKITKYV